MEKTNIKIKTSKLNDFLNEIEKNIKKVKFDDYYAKKNNNSAGLF